MKQTISAGAYGWCHSHWKNSFYPDDLPVEGDDDWRLSYYSNEFNTVLVPASYWADKTLADCEQWLDDVHPDFKFFVECHVSMFDFISLAEFKGNLEKLQPQISALVFLDDMQVIPESTKSQLITMLDLLDLDIFGPGFAAKARPVWREEKPEQSSFAFYKNDLSDLRSARLMIEKFVSNFKSTSQSATIIVDHPQLQAEDLSKFCTVLEIMGY